MYRSSQAIPERSPRAQAEASFGISRAQLDVLRVDTSGSFEGPMPICRRSGSPDLEQRLTDTIHPGWGGLTGSTIRLAQRTPVTLDWLRLGKCNCFATFVHSVPSVTDCALLLSQQCPSDHEAHLNWFAQQALPGMYGGTCGFAAIAKAAAWPDPLMVIVAPRLLERHDNTIDEVERQFGLRFLHVIRREKAGTPISRP